MSAGRTFRRNMGRAEQQQLLDDARTAEPRFVGHVDRWHDAFMTGEVMNIVPRIPADADAELLGRIYARRSVAINGECVHCGATRIVKGKRGRYYVAVEHDNGCPAFAEVGAQ